MANILDKSSVREIYIKILEVPSSIDVLSTYERDEVLGFAKDIKKSREKGVYDLFNQAPQYIELKKDKLISEGIKEENLFEYLLNEDSLYSQASIVVKNIEFYKNKELRTRISKKDSELKLLDLANPENKTSKVKRTPRLERNISINTFKEMFEKITWEPVYFDALIEIDLIKKIPKGSDKFEYEYMGPNQSRFWTVKKIFVIKDIIKKGVAMRLFAELLKTKIKGIENMSYTAFGKCSKDPDEQYINKKIEKFLSVSLTAQ
ncbi:MAG: hypothetical protein NTW82_12725 [Bacteroidia bacterium]|nr:hypothetical protein [Bacteroidia bacterium]